MKLEETSRGFSISKFEDRYGEKCSLQASSLAYESCIWLGISSPAIKEMGWHSIYKGRIRDVPEENLNGMYANGRMHLTREMVAKLLPYLTRFVETGELCEDSEHTE